MSLLSKRAIALSRLWKHCHARRQLTVRVDANQQNASENLKQAFYAPGCATRLNSLRRTGTRTPSVKKQPAHITKQNNNGCDIPTNEDGQERVNKKNHHN